MKKILLGLALLSAMTAASVSNASIHPMEVCAIGTTCSYSISGQSKRVIYIYNIQAKHRYLCRRTYGRGSLFTIENITPSDGTTMKVGPTMDDAFTITGPQKGTGKVQFDLRNHDLYFTKNRIQFICD